MSYAVALDPDALDDLNKLPPPVQQFVEAEIDRLAVGPTRLSKPSTFPFVPCQCMRTMTELDGERWYFTILFRYGQDESTLHILSIPSFVT